MGLRFHTVIANVWKNLLFLQLTYSSLVIKKKV